MLSLEDAKGKTVIDGNKAIIALPYLNPVHPHKQLVRLSMLVDGQTENIQISGTGEEWSVQHFPIPTAKQMQNRFRTFFVCAGLILFAIVIYGWYIETRRHISLYELSWRGLFVNLPPVAFVLLIILWGGYRGVDI